MRLLLLSLFALLCCTGMARTTFAQADPSILSPALQTNDCNYITGQLKAKCIPIFIGHLVVQVFRLLSAFFVLNVLYAGYQVAIGAWSGEKSAGKDRLLWSVIGLIVSVLAFVILDLVLSVIAPDV